MKPNEFNKEFEWITQFLKIIGLLLIALALLCNLFLGNALIRTVLWINSLQLIVHLPMIGVIVPPCVLTFYHAWLKIATFDILRNDDFLAIKLFFKFDVEK